MLKCLTDVSMKQLAENTTLETLDLVGFSLFYPILLLCTYSIQGSASTVTNDSLGLVFQSKVSFSLIHVHTHDIHVHNTHIYSYLYTHTQDSNITTLDLGNDSLSTSMCKSLFEKYEISIFKHNISKQIFFMKEQKEHFKDCNFESSG